MTESGRLGMTTIGLTINTGTGGQTQIVEGGTPAREIVNRPDPELLRSAQARALKETVGDIAPPKEYDYVFIGGGASAGAASRDLLALFDQAEELKKQGFSVCILESGVDKPTKIEEIPAAHGAASEHPDLAADPDRTGKGTGYWVSHFTKIADGLRDPKAGTIGKLLGKIWKPRGEGWGGSARLNANVFVRVDDIDWDKLAFTMGDPAFRAENMKKLFNELAKPNYQPVMQLLQKIGETIGVVEGRDPRFASIEISRAELSLLKEDKQLAKVALRSMLHGIMELGTPMEKLQRMLSLFDSNADRVQGTEGPVLMGMSIDGKGKRNGARGMILGAKELWGDQLTLQDGARAKHIILEGEENRATGVVYVDPKGKEVTIKAKREVIMACGAEESAALMMRSGIAPESAAGDLAHLGIEHKAVLDGVGQNQGDRYEVGLTVRMKEPFELVKKLKATLEELDPNDPYYKKWAAGEGGPLAINGAVASFQVRSRPDLKEPDLFIFAVPGKFAGYKPYYSKEALEDPNLMTFLVLDANKGKMMGELKLNKDNALGHPEINHHFFHERTGIGGDGKTPSPDSFPVAFGVEWVRDLIEKRFKNEVARDADGKPEEIWEKRDEEGKLVRIPTPRTHDDVRLRCEERAWGHHPRGGMQGGHPNDKMTVCDANFRVRKTVGLRCIDASFLPDNIGTFIVSGIYELGKLAARKIAADAMDGPKPAARENWLSIRNDPLPKSADEADRVTKKQAEAARKEGLLTKKQFERLTDGTVSTVDVDVAWKAIESALKTGHDIGSDRHTIAHNLLIAVSNQLDKQTSWQTRRESFTDKATRMWEGLV